MGRVKKAQIGKSIKPTADSTKYYDDLYNKNLKSAKNLIGLEMTTEKNQGSQRAFDRAFEALDNKLRQSRKGKPGYDENGFPKKGGQLGKSAGKSMRKGGKVVKVKKAQKGYSAKKNEAAFIEGLNYLKKRNTTKATPKNVGRAAGSLMKKGGKVAKKSGSKMKQCRGGCY